MNLVKKIEKIGGQISEIDHSVDVICRHYFETIIGEGTYCGWHFDGDGDIIIEYDVGDWERNIPKTTYVDLKFFSDKSAEEIEKERNKRLEKEKARQKEVQEAMRKMQEESERRRYEELKKKFEE